MNVAETYGYISKWGPCTREISNLMSRPSDMRAHVEEQFADEAKVAAKAICAQPDAYAHPERKLAPSEGFAILFMKPHRPLVPGTPLVATSGRSIHHPYPLPCRDLPPRTPGDCKWERFVAFHHALFARAGPAWDFAHRSSTAR